MGRISPFVAPVVVALLGSGGSVAANPPSRFERGAIAFTSERAISLVRSDGSGRRLVVNGRRMHWSPSWAPDGSLLVFARFDERTAALFVVRRDGTGLRRIASGISPAWSPAGDQIAFVDSDEGVTGIFLVRPDGRGRRRLTSPRRLHDFDPAWSPDGNRIAFVRGDEEGSIYTLDVKGGSLRRLTKPRTDSAPDWSPDGRSIAFVRQQRIYVMGSDGSRPRRVSRTPRGWEQYEWFDLRPSWSPDGELITFSSFLEEPGVSPPFSEIYVMRRDGSARVRLTYSTGNQYDPDWGRVP